MSYRSYQFDESTESGETGDFDINVNLNREQEPSNWVKYRLKGGIALVIAFVGIALLVTANVGASQSGSLKSPSADAAPLVYEDWTARDIAGDAPNACVQYSIHAGDQVTFNGATTAVLNGNLGVSPGNVIQGETPSQYVIYAGMVELATNSSKACEASKQPQYEYLISQKCDFTVKNGDLTGLTLLPGVYCSGTGSFTTQEFGITVLDAQDDSYAQFIFLAPEGTVQTGKSSSLYLLNASLVKYVYWAVGNGIVLGESSAIAGTLLSMDYINFYFDATIIGHALSKTSVTFSGQSTTSIPLPILQSSITLNKNRTPMKDSLKPK